MKLHERLNRRFLRQIKSFQEKNIMKKSILYLLLLTIFMTLTTSLNAQLPPLIDRKILFDNPEIAGSQISPDGKYISF